MVIKFVLKKSDHRPKILKNQTKVRKMYHFIKHNVHQMCVKKIQKMNHKFLKISPKSDKCTILLNITLIMRSKKTL